MRRLTGLILLMSGCYGATSTSHDAAPGVCAPSPGTYHLEIEGAAEGDCAVLNLGPAASVDFELNADVFCGDEIQSLTEACNVNHLCRYTDVSCIATAAGLRDCVVDYSVVDENNARLVCVESLPATWNP